MKNLKIALFLCLSSYLSISSSASYVSYNQAVTASNILKNLIETLHSNPVNFPNKDINAYIKNYTIFKNYVAQLEREKGSKDDDVVYYKQYYLAPYQDFYQKIIDYAEKNPTELQEIHSILQQVQNQIMQAFQDFSNTITVNIKNFGSYSEDAKRKYFNLLQGAVKTFEANVNSLEQAAREEFFEYQQKLGQDIDPYRPSPVQITLLNSVRNLAQDALIQVHALSLDLTAQHMNLDFASQTAAALEKHKKEAEENYQKTLKEHENAADKSWWQETKQKGLVYIESFKKEFLKQIMNKVQDEVLKAAKQFGGELIDDVKKKIGLIEILNTNSIENLSKNNSTKLQVLRAIIKLKYPVATLHQQAQVRVQQTKELSTAERTFLRSRMAKVSKTLKDEFYIDVPLRLAFCCSGGGNRAMIGTLGLLKAAARSHILDASLYIAGLSGSTWAIAPWSYMYTKGLLPKQYEQSFEKIIDNLTLQLDYPCKAPLGGGKCGPPLITSQITQNIIIENIAKRFGYQQSLSLINMYGPSIGNYALDLVGNNKLNVMWSELSQDMQRGEIPLPLCSCCFDPSQDSETNRNNYAQTYEWMETGPFEAGSSSLGYIPIWALGSVFDKGVITQSSPEYPISFMLGIYGSAFSLSINDFIYRGIKKNPTYMVAGQEIELPVDAWISEMFDTANADSRAQRSGAHHAYVANFAKGLSTSKVASVDELALFDGAMCFNLPLPLLFDRPERAIDIVVMYDSSPGDVNTLLEADKYFKRKNISMPNMSHVTKKSLISRPMTVFNDPRDSRYNKSMPTLIYIPTPDQDITYPPYNIDTTIHYPYVKKAIDKTKAPYVTFNFKYDKEEIYNLSQTMESVFESLVEQITDIMKIAAKKKNKNNEQIS